MGKGSQSGREARFIAGKRRQEAMRVPGVASSLRCQIGPTRLVQFYGEVQNTFRARPAAMHHDHGCPGAIQRLTGSQQWLPLVRAIYRVRRFGQTLVTSNASHEGLVAPRRYRVQISSSTVMNFILSAWLACLGLRQAERRQRLLNLFSLRLQPGRQLQMGSQLPDRFIHCEPWRISRDFKEDASRLAKVNRVEVLAIQHRRDIEVKTSQHPVPSELTPIGSSTRGHM